MLLDQSSIWKGLSVGCFVKWPFSCSNHPKTRSQKIRETSRFYSLLKWFKIANPEPAYSASSVSPCGNHDKGVGPISLSVSLPPTSLGDPPPHSMVIPPLGICEYNTLSSLFLHLLKVVCLMVKKGRQKWSYHHCKMTDELLTFLGTFLQTPLPGPHIRTLSRLMECTLMYP